MKFSTVGTYHRNKITTRDAPIRQWPIIRWAIIGV